MRVDGANIEQMQIRVPIDRTTTRFMLYSAHAPAVIEFAVQPAVPDYQIPVFPADASSHRRDAPRFCPGCASPLALADGGRGPATEYWVARDRVFVCFCGSCGWTGDIVLAERVVGHGAE